jgi:hypothetical protein
VCLGGRAVISLAPGPGKVRVGLVMHPLDRVIDVSIQPAAACEMLRDAGRQTSSSASTIEATARDALLEAHDRCASWAPCDSAGMLAGFGGAAFPLLAAAYDAGSSPVREVPRWAEPVVAARTAREGAIAAFGPRTTRPVVRALAGSLNQEASNEVDFSNLALAMIGSDILEPDCLARVLGAPRVAHPAQHLPDPSTLHAARQAVTTWGATRAERVLLDAATSTDGVKLLLDAARWCLQLRGQGPACLPNRLAEIHDAYRSRVASAPPPPPPPQARPVQPQRATALFEPQPPQHRIFAPPANLAPVADSTPLAVPPAVRALHGLTFGDLTFTVPRTAGDLQRWGRMLSNCLGGFGPAAASGRTAVVGIERANVLAFAVEIRDGSIRQFAGHANRAPNDATRTAVVRRMRAAGILRPGAA